jgi:hypothetical protein
MLGMSALLDEPVSPLLQAKSLKAAVRSHIGFGAALLDYPNIPELVGRMQ